MDGDWISAARAYELVSGAAPFRAATAICSRANDGMIKARAKRLVWGSEALSDSEVPSQFWWARGERALVQNWVSGDFETWIDQRVHCRAYGVEFSRPDVEAMVPARTPRKLTLDRSEPGNYASAAKCRRELQTTLGCQESQAEGIILRACRAGMVSARCKDISWRVTDRYGSTEFEDINVSIPDWFWEKCLGGSDTILNWASGRFAGKGYIDGDEYKVKVSGVEFQVGDIIDLETVERPREPLGNLVEANDADKAGQSASMGRRPSDKWRIWVAELAAYLHEQGTPEGVGSQGQEELIQAIATSLAERGHETLARSTVQPVVQAVLDRLRAAEK